MIRRESHCIVVAVFAGAMGSGDSASEPTAARPGGRRSAKSSRLSSSGQRTIEAAARCWAILTVDLIRTIAGDVLRVGAAGSAGLFGIGSCMRTN